MLRDPASVRRVNLCAALAFALAAALALGMLCLPLYSFSATVFTKKSGNTFVGDEKYLAARAEAEEAARARAARNGGMPVEIVENVTERTNSKGEKTSMVAFEVREDMRRTGLDFIRSGLAAGNLLLAAAIFVALSLVMMGFGLAGNTLSTDWPELPALRHNLRRAAVWLALIALLIIPVFRMSCNLAFSRQIKLAADGFPRENAEALLQRLDAFLYGGTAGWTR